MKAIIKNKKQLDDTNGAIFNGEGWHLKGQFFPIEGVCNFQVKHLNLKKYSKIVTAQLLKAYGIFFQNKR